MDESGFISLENGTEYVILVDEPITFLSILSICAIITTVSLFFCGIPICMEIFRRKSTKEISGFPFVMGFLGGSFWLRYGFLKYDLTMITVNVVGVSLMFMYITFYIYYTCGKKSILIQFGTASSLIALMLIIVQMYQVSAINYLGFVCMSFNILNFGAPLAGVRVVFRKKCCDSLPLPLCTANLLVSSQWCIYGILVDDIYIIIPNSAGVILAVMQLSLFLIFPHKLGSRAPLSYCLSTNSRIGKDVEKVKELYRHRENKPQKPNLPDAKQGLKPCSWRKTTLPDRSTSSIRISKKPVVYTLRNMLFGESRSSSTTTTCTGLTWASTSHMSSSLADSEDIPKIIICPSDNEIDEDEVNVETPLNSPSPNNCTKQSFQFDRIPEIDYLDQIWKEGDLRRTQSVPAMKDLTDK